MIWIEYKVGHAHVHAMQKRDDLQNNLAIMNISLKSVKHSMTSFWFSILVFDQKGIYSEIRRFKIKYCFCITNQIIIYKNMLSKFSASWQIILVMCMTIF